MTNRQELIKSFLHKVKAANKERTKIDHFKDLLNRLYSGDKEIEKIIECISSGTETTILNIPRKDKLHRGSADTLYNKIIIEFENDLKLSLRHAKEIAEKLFNTTLFFVTGFLNLFKKRSIC